MHTIKASEFKAKCLHIMDEVNESGEEVIITKNGVPVSRLVPYRKPVHSLFGFSRDILSSKDDLITPTGMKWDADEC
jgi:prevent-host-death family protein